MSNRNQQIIKKRLTTAYNELSVDSFKQIKEAPQKTFSSMEEVLGENAKSNRGFCLSPTVWGSFVAAAIAVAIMFNVHYKSNVKYAYIYVDVNPSIELMVNQKGDVVRCRAYNSDGEDIVSAQAVVESVKKKEKLDVVMENVIKSIRDKGYFSGQYDSVLVSSANTDIFEDDYMDKVISEVAGYVEEKKMCNNVVYNEVADYESAKEKGEQYGISPGKANYVEEIAKKVVYTEAELATKNIDSILDLETETYVMEATTTASLDITEAAEANTIGLEEMVTNSVEETVGADIAETEEAAEQFTEYNTEIITTLEIASNEIETTEAAEIVTDEETVKAEENTSRQEEITTVKLQRLKISVKKTSYEDNVLSVEFEKKVRWSENCIVRVTSSNGSIKKADFVSKGPKRCSVQISGCIPGENYIVYFEGIKRNKTDNFLNCTVSFTIPDSSK